MIQPAFTVLLLSVCTSLFAQSTPQSGVWFKYFDEKINEEIFDQYYDNTSDTVFFPSIAANISGSPATVYWDGTNWRKEAATNVQPIFIMLPFENNSARIVLSVDSPAEKYDVFTDEGWVHVDNTIQYNYYNDYLHYDEANNRLIMFKQNIPWLFYLEN